MYMGLLEASLYVAWSAILFMANLSTRICFVAD
jgi:hypothetical protein